MKNLNQMSQCQTLWARNKYLVLSHSSKIYLEIRQYLKSESVEVAHVQALIDQAVALPENRGQVCNAFQHIWGYFKKKASPAEKDNFMLLLLRYQSGQAEQKDLVTAVKDLLLKYPNPYLQKSTLLFQNEEWCLAINETSHTCSASSLVITYDKKNNNLYPQSN